MDDFRDFRSGVKEKIADKYHGSKFESGVNKTKGWFKGVGSGIAGMAKSAGNWVKDKATDAGTAIKGSKLGQWVSRRKVQQVHDRREKLGVRQGKIGRHRDKGKQAGSVGEPQKRGARQEKGSGSPEGARLVQKDSGGSRRKDKIRSRLGQG